MYKEPELSQCKILHWAGTFKPWMSNPSFTEEWKKYNKETCHIKSFWSDRISVKNQPFSFSILFSRVCQSL